MTKRQQLTILMLALPGVLNCQKKEVSEGLPAAGDWQVPNQNTAEARENTKTEKVPKINPHGSTATDPHAGLNLGKGSLKGSDPHAGMDISGMAGTGMDPHAGLEMDPEMAKFDPPDPNRKIDAAKFLAGKVSIKKEYQSAISDQAVLFFSVRPIDKLTGDVIGSPLAVDIVKELKWPIEFHLSEVNTMVAGTEFTGNVEVYVRVDGDGEARTKEPGDIEGSVTTSIPQKDLNIVLSNRLR